MEYARDIILNLQDGQTKEINKSFFNKFMKHKIMLLVTFITLGFMILDIVLVSNFINALITL